MDDGWYGFRGYDRNGGDFDVYVEVYEYMVDEKFLLCLSEGLCKYREYDEEISEEDDIVMVQLVVQWVGEGSVEEIEDGVRGVDEVNKLFVVIDVEFNRE